MKKALLAGLLAISSVVAQPTGDWGRAAMMGADGIPHSSPVSMILSSLLYIGLILVVWLWAFKLWKEIRHMK